MTVASAPSPAPSPDGPRLGAVVLRRGAACAVLLALAWMYRCPVPTDWDAWDYTSQAVTAQSSDLLLGRWWFVAMMHGVWRVAEAAGLSPLQAHLPMQAVSAAMMAGALWLGMAWTRRLTGSDRAEAAFALMVLPGPLIGIYATAVMTEAATLCTLTAALYLWQLALESHRPRGRSVAAALAAGACLGIAVDMRETVGLLALWWPLSLAICRRTDRLRLLIWAAAAGIATLAIGVIGGWAWHPGEATGPGLLDSAYVQNLRGWIEAMRIDRDRYGLSIGANFLFLSQYAFLAAPVAAMGFFPAAVWAAGRNRAAALLVLAGGPFFLSMLLNHDVAINPRHPLPLMWVYAAVSAAAIAAAAKGRRPRRPKWRTACVLGLTGLGGAAVLAAGWQAGLLKYHYFNYCQRMQRVHAAMVRLPDEAAVIAGPGTPVGYYLNRIGARDLRQIAPSGWEFPHQELSVRIERCLEGGRPLYVNLNAVDWEHTYKVRVSGEFQAVRAAVKPYRRGEAIGPLVRILPPKADDTPEAAQPPDAR